MWVTWTSRDELVGRALPVLLVVLVVVFAPGAALLAALGVRGLPLFALAAPATTAILGVGAVLAGFAGVPWQPWIGLLLTVVVTAIAWLLRRWWGTPEALAGPTPDRGGRILLGGMVVAALVGALPLARGIRFVDRVPQTWDAVFHLNALRYILDTGRASSLLLAGVNNHLTGSGFYPAGWHVTAASVMQLTGADPAVVANLMTLVLAGLIVPAGTALASRALMPDWRWAGGVGAVAGTLFAALPAMMVSWGTLWPNAWGTGALPALLGAALLALRRPSLTAWTAILIALGGASIGPSDVPVRLRPARYAAGCPGPHSTVARPPERPTATPGRGGRRPRSPGPGRSRGAGDVEPPRPDQGLQLGSDRVDVAGGG